ncbi:MAG: lysophospholipid acyltransferase family protein [Eubacteriales bacterium]|nr:lysophospholipid acyltransferase family protein [Eubacteriales bacterium]
MNKRSISMIKDDKDSKDSIYRRYPLKRGITGWFGYIGGMLLSRLLIRLRAEGTENIPKHPPYVLAPNHVTYVDGMWVASFLPYGHFNDLCCMAAKELEDSHGPFGRLIVRVGRGIAADRFGNPIRALIIAKQQLDKGQILLLHPEGTRSSDGGLGEFKDGAAYLSMKANCPLIPVYIEGGYDVFNRHMKYPRPFIRPFRRKTVTVHYGQPLDPDDYSSAHEMTSALSGSVDSMRENTIQ